MPRDSQRSKVFSALADVGQMEFCSSSGLRGLDLARLIANSRGFRAAHGHYPVVLITRERSCWLKQSGNLYLPEQMAVSPINVLHAFAHCYSAKGIVPSGASPLHGSEFAKEMLHLTKRWMEADAYTALYDKFREYKVKTRTVSPEAKAAARDRYLDRKAASLEDDLRALSERLRGVG